MVRFKKWAALLVAAMLVFGALMVSACGDNRIPREDEQIGDTDEEVYGSLSIRLWDGGFGSQWLSNVIGGFKAKYPNTTVELSKTKERMVAYAEILATKENQKYDLFFTESLLFDRIEDLEPLDDVYSHKWDGEDGTILEKMAPYITDFYQMNDESRYMISSYVSSYGFAYNTDYVTGDLPNTTNELLALFTTLKGNGITPLIFSGETDYFNQIYCTWFAQYQGMDEFAASEHGKIINAEGEAVVDVRSTYLPGSQHAMKACEDILWLPNGNIHNQSVGLQFMSAQKKFLDGDAAFMANGAWMTNEMSDLYPDGIYNVEFMKMPIISSIVERCPTITSDQELSALIDAIDAGSDALTGSGYSVSQEDFDRVSDARKIVYIAGEGATGVVPKTAQNKELAKLFLKYMYSDAGIRLFVSAGAGNMLPVVGYDFTEELKNTDVYKKSAIEILASSDMFFKNNKNSAIKPFCTVEGISIEKQFGSPNPGDRTTAQKSFNDKKDSYTKNNNTRFLNELRAAGIIK